MELLIKVALGSKALIQNVLTEKRILAPSLQLLSFAALALSFSRCQS